MRDADDIYDSFVNAIVTGRLKGGSRMPTMQQIADANGVTFRVARGVVERLVREGYARSYPHIGTIVRTKNHTVWNGRVAFVLFDDDSASYFVSSVIDAVRRCVLREGYLFTPVVAARSPRGDCSQLKALLGQRVDFVVLMYPSRHLERIVGASGVPFAVLFGQQPSRPHAWTLPLDLREPVEAFVRHCLGANIRTVTEVRFAGGDRPPGMEELKAAGVKIREVVVTPLRDFGRHEGIERASMERFLDWPREEFPDLLAIGDDFVAQGVLTAFLRRGVRIPGELRVVTVSNRGLGPVYPEALTRFEWDGAAVGNQVADFVIDLLAKGRQPMPPCLRPAYIFGRTFPWQG